MKRLAAATLLALEVGTVGASPCGMEELFRQEDEGTTRPVLGTSDRKALLFTEKLNVNTDGTRRSYSVTDFWGETTALNNLCNAMSDACAGLSDEQLRERRIQTQQAMAHGWPQEELAMTRISSSIIPFKAGKPCPAVDGYLVSATALAKPVANDVCDLSNYVDALETPALVIPGGDNGFRRHGVKIGDLVVAVTPGANVPVFGVVGDTGPAKSLGEASIAMNGALLGMTSPPENYKEVRGRVPGRRSWVVPKATVLIFPGTRDVNSPYMSLDRINAVGSQVFEAWGGLARLKSCADGPSAAGSVTGSATPVATPPAEPVSTRTLPNRAESLLSGPGIWVKNPRTFTSANANDLASLGFKRAHIMVTQDFKSFSGCDNASRLVPLTTNENVAKAVRAARNAGLTTIVTAYVPPSKAGIDALIAPAGLVATAIEAGAVAVEFDLEGAWSKSKACGFDDHASALAYLRNASRTLALDTLVGITTHTGRARDPHIPLTGTDFVSLQAYSKCEPDNCVPFDGPDGPGARQRSVSRLLQGYLGRIIVGLPAYSQKWEGHTIADAMQRGLDASREIARDDARIVGFSYWSTATVLRTGAERSFIADALQN